MTRTLWYLNGRADAFEGKDRAPMLIAKGRMKQLEQYRAGYSMTLARLRVGAARINGALAAVRHAPLTK